MGSIVYFAIEPPNRSVRYPRPSFGGSMGSGSSSGQPVEILHRHCPARTLATCWEILFATFCSLIASSYAFHHERRDVHSPASGRQIMASENGHFGFILDPPPALMLGACLVLGCAISSFAYRRQEQDKLQTPIFISAITVATTVGLALGVNANLIMLGMIPWALCTAMVFSTAVHWLMRRCSRNESYSELRCCELGEKKVVASSQ